jgi:hypothetical protein
MQRSRPARNGFFDDAVAAELVGGDGLNADH